METGIIDKSKIKTGIKIFLILTVISLLVILLLTGSKETLKIFKHIAIPYFLLTLFIALVFAYFNAIRIIYIARSMGKNLSILDSLYFSLGGNLLGAITPFQSGGAPFQLYLLTKRSFSVAESTALIVIRGVLPALIVPFALPFVVFRYASFFHSSAMKMILFYLLILYIIIIIIFLMIFFIPSRLEKFLLKVIKRENIKEKIPKIFKSLEDFKLIIFNFFRKGGKNALIAILFTYVSLAANFLLAPAILYTIGLKTSIIDATVVQFVLTYIIAFTPTPGASGVAELAGAALFSTICPKTYIPVYIVYWRFFSSYLFSIIGAFFLIDFIRKDIK
ncbi:MAG: flippase-like domain-containing protein [Proteobacteria bacterium]|nr:flippase-like domain-containing protein [Pseudomonadota bacterium]